MLSALLEKVDPEGGTFTRALVEHLLSLNAGLFAADDPFFVEGLFPPTKLL